MGSFRLRTILFISFTLLSVVPVIFLGVWVQRTSFENELSNVEEQHLLLARNMTQALSRYVTDTEIGFDLMAQGIANGAGVEKYEALMNSLNIRQICIVNNSGEVETEVPSIAGKSMDVLPEAVAQEVLGINAEDGVKFSDATMSHLDLPAIFLTRRLPDNNVALGILTTEYLGELQEKIAFGEGGHAAIVDAKGQLLAHPFKEWSDQIKSIAKIDPVQRMMQGKTGVSQFFSPAKKADMIAGFSVVPKTGWGVMVPQPIHELEQRANSVQMIALGIIALGVVVAALLSWWLAGYFSRPVQSVAAAANELSNNQFGIRVKTLPRLVPVELKSLAQTFNTMTEKIEQLVSSRTSELARAKEQLEDEVSERKVAQLQLKSAHEQVENQLKRHTNEIAKLKVAEQKLAESERTLREHEKRYRGLAQSAADYFWELDADLRLRYLSNDFEKIVGLPTTELIGLPVAGIWRRLFVESKALMDHLALLNHHQPFNDVILEWNQVSAPSKYIRISGKPITGANGEFLGFYGSGRGLPA